MKKTVFKVGTVSDAGIKKDINEDEFVFKIVETKENSFGIFAVADGVGGLCEGKLASSFAISQLNKWWEDEFKANFEDKEYVVSSLIKCIKNTNTRLLEKNEQDSKKRATTISVLFIYKQEYFVVHIGDSRIYEINRKITQLTKDHIAIVDQSAGSDMIRRSVLTQCIGVKGEILPFCSNGQIKKNSVFLVCSDGAYKKIPDEEILKTVKANKPHVQEMCKTLVNAAKERRESDNITVIAVNIK